MSVFKLLSSSSQPLRSGSPAQTLPSSGSVENPQLFGNHNTSRKRKREHQAEETLPAHTNLPADIDFFGSENCRMGQHVGLSTLIDGEGSKPQQHNKKGLVSENQAHGMEENSLHESECKRILRSHKLKIVVLQDFTSKVERLSTESTLSKKSKKNTEGKEKNSHTKHHLYPQPLTTFAQLRTRYGISRRLAENIMEQGYRLPTEVQLGALPLLLREKRRENDIKTSVREDSYSAKCAGNIDLLTVAPTGSGKTVAFLIPIINALLAEGKTPSSKQGPRAILLAPTRELASQIVNEARKLAKGTAVKASLMRKGMEVVERPPLASQEDTMDWSEEDTSDSNDQAQAVQKSQPTQRQAKPVQAAILVATPLALLNALKTGGSAVANLPSVAHLILDEADILLDPLFREQTLAIWNACTNVHLRIGLWSATMGSNIETLVLSTLEARWSGLTSSLSNKLPPRPPLIRIVVGLKDSAIPNISHQLTYAATEAGKLIGLRQLLHPTSLHTNTSDHATLRPPFLVFTQTIPRSTALYSELLYDIPSEAGGSSRIAVLHADLSSSARDNIMSRFRQGEIWVLITTDLLARGVDFRGLNGVVNYDVPNSAATYVHRVGRTGRAGRGGGVAVTFYTQEDIPYIKLIANAIRASEKLRGVKAEDGSVKPWLLDALPTPSKRDRQRLKKRGVEARRTFKDENGKSRNRISTKSGYIRKKENNRRGAKMASRQREQRGDCTVEEDSDGESNGLEGFEE